MKARTNGICDRCHDQIRTNEHDVVMRHGRWIHASCAAGGDEQ